MAVKRSIRQAVPKHEFGSGKGVWSEWHLL